MPVFKLLITFSSQAEWENWARGQSKSDLEKMIIDIFPPEDPTKSVDRPFPTLNFKPERNSWKDKVIVRKRHEKIKGNDRCVVCQNLIPEDRMAKHDTCPNTCSSAFSMRKSYLRKRVPGLTERTIEKKAIEYFNDKYQR